MAYIMRGPLPTKPPKTVWWGIEVYDGRDWLKCDIEETKASKRGKAKKTVRWWPVSTLPTPDFIGSNWGSGNYRITWTAHDKRSSLQVSEAFQIIDTDDPQLAHLLQGLAGDPSKRGLLNPEQLMSLPPHMAPAQAELRCTHCGRSEAESPLAMFQYMFVLMDRYMDRQATAMNLQHERAMADIRSNQHVALEQTRSFFQEMHQMSLGPRLAALESQLREVAEYDGEEGDPSLATVAKEAAPALVLLLENYLNRRTAAKRPPPSPAITEGEEP